MLKVGIFLLLALLTFSPGESGTKHLKMQYKNGNWRPHFGYRRSHYANSHG